MRIGQRVGLAGTPEALATDRCCLSETSIQGPSALIRLHFSSNIRAKFIQCLFGNPKASLSGHASVGVALSARAEDAMLDWIPVNRRLRAVGLEGL